ncbi:unnamed protein product [Ilex paraguariensis]|uniref:Glycosyltransferase 61 catalytic domain-containing protein n=1 Tax=Ilex paraguariensis TaxID=185542 RepID=A0ABC8UZU6_9AQUA
MKKKGSPIVALCLAMVLLFFLSGITLNFYGSYTSYSTKTRGFIHFHELLETTYGHKAHNHSSISLPWKGRWPRLVLTSHKISIGCVILNQDEAAKEVGFVVIVFEPTLNTPLRESCALMHSTHVIVGVHGAALTHSLFLCPGSVFVQVVPIGVERESDIFFGKSARELGLEYTECKIGVGESSLL